MRKIGEIKNSKGINNVFISKCKVKNISSTFTVYETGDVHVNRNPLGGVNYYDNRQLHSETTRTVFLELEDGQEYIVYLNQFQIDLRVGSNCEIMFVQFNDGTLVPQRIYNSNTQLYSIIPISGNLFDITKSSKIPMALIQGILSYFIVDYFLDFNKMPEILCGVVFALFAFLFFLGSYFSHFYNIETKYVENLNFIFNNRYNNKITHTEQENSNISKKIIKFVFKSSLLLTFIFFISMILLFFYGVINVKVNQEEIIQYAKTLEDRADPNLKLKSKYDELILYARKKSFIGIDLTYVQVLNSYFRANDKISFDPVILGGLLTLPEDIKNVNVLLGAKHKKGRTKGRSFTEFSQKYFGKKLSQLNKEEWIFSYQVVVLGRNVGYSNKQVSRRYIKPCKMYIENYEFYKSEFEIKNKSIYDNCIKTIEKYGN